MPMRKAPESLLVHRLVGRVREDDLVQELVVEPEQIHDSHGEQGVRK